MPNLHLNFTLSLPRFCPPARNCHFSAMPGCLSPMGLSSCHTLCLVLFVQIQLGNRPPFSSCPPGLMGFVERLFPLVCVLLEGLAAHWVCRLPLILESYYTPLVQEFSKGVVLFIFASPGPTLERKWIKHPCRRRSFQCPKSKAIFCPLLCICLSAPQVQFWPEGTYGWMVRCSVDAGSRLLGWIWLYCLPIDPWASYFAFPYPSFTIYKMKEMKMPASYNIMRIRWDNLPEPRRCLACGKRHEHAARSGWLSAGMMTPPLSCCTDSPLHWSPGRALPFSCLRKLSAIWSFQDQDFLHMAMAEAVD